MKSLSLILFLIIQILSAQQTGKPVRSILIIGAASTTSKPNIVQISIGASYTDSNIPSAMKKTNKAMNELYQICKSLRIDTNDIQTNNLSINKDYDYSRADGRSFRGYQVANNYSITIRNIKIVDTLVSRISASGINEIGSLRFAYDKADILKDSLNLVAIGDAKQKAEKMAVKAGMKLGKPIKICDPHFYENQPAGFGKMLAGYGGGGGPAISAGNLTIETSVAVEFELIE